MISVKLVAGDTTTALHTEEIYNGFHRVEDETIILITAEPAQVHGTFQTAVLSSATTTTMVTPEGNGSILITDIVVSAKKVASTTMIIQFNDDINQAVLISPDSINTAVNFSWSPKGRIQGWRNARLDVVTTGANTDATVTIGYMKVGSGLPYSEWNSHR